MPADAVVSILALTLFATGGVLARLPVGTCRECAHCQAERQAAERDAEARISRYLGIPICRSCGRHHVPEDEHRT